MVNSHAHEIPGGTDELDSTALRLHGKRYIQLTDDEADAVWNDIESRESRVRKTCAHTYDCDCDTIAAELAAQGN